MTGLRIYVEGGGDCKHQKRVLRLGFQEFLEPLRDAARARHITWDVILCGSRGHAYDDYLTALRVHPEAINLLLVDAEGPVTQPPWEHLRTRDGWTDPGVGDDRCHLMVQTVEAWLIADPEALEEYYGHSLYRRHLPRDPDVEAIPKARLLAGRQPTHRKRAVSENRPLRGSAGAGVRPKGERTRVALRTIVRHC